ncbi:MAG: type secretion system protein [Phycisphaerales bacterium]|nr:type secretion system protein [Phycisphaerales bacterium]MDB5354819.1 type secretion system protein [Phycisphaerales bacterium]
MRNAAHVSFRRAAFSLVELLIVVGIIAVLLAIVVPVMSRARNSARLVACQSNVRQLVQASIAYASDNDGVLPLPNLQGQDAPTNAGWLYRDALPGTPGPTLVQTGVLWKYLNSMDVYHCPLDVGPWLTGKTETLTSYLMNPSVMNPALKSTKIPPPSSYPLRRMNPQAILFLECDQSPPPPRGSPLDPPPPPVKPQSWIDGTAQLDKDDAVRHGTVGACIGCFDGHIEMISSGDYASQQALYKLIPPQGRLYCLAP